MNISKIVEALKCCKKTGANSYQALCPAHDDRKASLTITDAGDKILLHCHAGCELKNILNAINLKESDLFNNKEDFIKPKLIAEYFYTDENGNKLYKAERYNPKSFKQAKFCNNEWIYNMNNVRYVLYNLPNVLKSNTIYFVEWEKDADNLNSIGLVATTSIGGASGFNKRASEYSNTLKNKKGYILPDNDKPGRKYAENIYNALKDVCNEVKILDLTNEIEDFKEKGDISDVLSEYGIEKTLEIIENLKNKNYENKVFPIQSIEELNEDTFEEILNYLGITINYNIITKRIEIMGMPKKYSQSYLYTILPIYLKGILKNKGIKINDTKKIEEFILLQISKNNFNPILDLLNNNKWDKQDRFEEICNIFNLKNDLNKVKLIKWLKQCVAMLLNNLERPFGAEGILTLLGKQGIGKSRILSLLVLNPAWIAEGVVLDMNNKDSKIIATSRWICELGEVDDTLKKEQSSLKAFITNSEDDIRPPYAKASIRRARNTSFCATVNVASFLKDDSGNRRFLVINLEKIDYKKLEELGYNWIQQLWLQVYEEVKKNINCFRLTDEEKRLIMEDNLKYTEFVPYEEDLMNIIKFDSANKTIWKNKQLIENFFPNANSQSIGRALNKIQNNYPNAVQIKRTSKGITYYMEIKKNILKRKMKEM